MTAIPPGDDLPIWAVVLMTVTGALGGREAVSGIVEWVKGRRAEDRAEKAADISEVEILKQRHATELAAADARTTAERKRADAAQERYDVAQTQIDAWRLKYRALEDLASGYKHAALRAGVPRDRLPVPNPIAGAGESGPVDAGEASFDAP